MKIDKVEAGRNKCQLWIYSFELNGLSRRNMKKHILLTDKEKIILLRMSTGVVNVRCNIKK